MNWIDSLENRYGRFAIPGLIRFIVGLNALVFVLVLLNKGFLSLLVFDKPLILQGQVWRLFSYIFIPALSSSWIMPDYLWLVFWLMFMWMLGDGLEQAWGAFRLDLFYLLGLLGTTVGAFFFGSNSSSVTLNLSLLFAFATIYPDYQIMLMLVLPVRIKWLAWFTFGMLMLSFVSGTLSLRIGILASFANYLVFFGPTLWRSALHRKAVSSRRAAYESQQVPEGESLHQCTICKRTELSDPDLDFRVAKDDNEYCLEHLPNRPGTPGVAELL